MKKIMTILATAAVAATMMFTACSVDAGVEIAQPVSWSSTYTFEDDIQEALLAGKAISVELTAGADSTVMFMDSWWADTAYTFYEEDGSVLFAADGTEEKRFKMKEDTKVYIKASDSQIALIDLAGGHNFIMGGNDYVVKTATVKVEKDFAVAVSQDDLKALQETIEELTDALEKITNPDPTLASVTSIALEDNVTAGNNYQAVVEIFDAANAYKPKAGDKLKFTLKGQSDVTNASVYKLFLVDNTAAAGWWKVISNYVETDVTATANTDFTIEAEFEIKEDASSAEPAACKLGIFVDATGNSTSTITVTELKVERL